MMMTSDMSSHEHRIPVDPFDVVIVGAGPAGALMGYLAAQAGLRAAIVEKDPFPRVKVCGGCVSARAETLLSQVGLSDAMRAIPREPLTCFRVRHGRRSLQVPLPGGFSICRSELDMALLEAAIRSGCHFYGNTTAHVRSADKYAATRRVALRQPGGVEKYAEGRVIVVASGLSHACLRDSKEMIGSVHPASRLGFGGRIAGHQVAIKRGILEMSIVREAYVGAVLLADGSVNIAGAAAPDFVKHCGGLEQCVEQTLLAAPWYRKCAASGVVWRGTELMTRRYRATAAERVLAIGDAAGYLEPFTGEGMTWAFLSACRAMPFVQRGLQRWDAQLVRDWNAQTRRVWSRQRRMCGVLSAVVRRPWAIDASMAALKACPRMTQKIATRVCAPRM